MALRKLRVKTVINADHGVPWLRPGECYEIDDIPGKDRREWLLVHEPGGKASAEGSARLFTDVPPCVRPSLGMSDRR